MIDSFIAAWHESFRMPFLASVLFSLRVGVYVGVLNVVAEEAKKLYRKSQQRVAAVD